MTKHIIHFYGAITPAAVEELRSCALSALQNGGATEIDVYISSEGGSLTSGFTAYNFLRSLPIQVNTHNMGNVESIAVIVFLAGVNRTVVSHGRFLIHPLNWGFPATSIDHARLSEFTDCLNFDAQRYTDIFNERTKGANQPIQVGLHLSGSANVLTSDAAVSSGIATAVVDVIAAKDSIHWWPAIVAR